MKLEWYSAGELVSSAAYTWGPSKPFSKSNPMGTLLDRNKSFRFDVTYDGRDKAGNGDINMKTSVSGTYQTG